MSWPKGVRKWSREEIFSDVMTAKEEFRRRRFGEPMDRYLEAFAILRNANANIIRNLPGLFEFPVDADYIADLLGDEALKTALRYLGAPPISDDDLKTLVGGSIAPTRVREDSELASSVRDVIIQILDPMRFPWVKTGDLPTDAEIDAAVLASTVVASAQKVQTSRRTDERNSLEEGVRGLLLGIGMQPVPSKKIVNIRRDAPQPGEFTQRSCVLGEDDADIVLTLYDHRVMAIECKGSNSEVNSRKRINKEICQNAQSWIHSYGNETVVVGAALRGVFKPVYLELAQDKGVGLFWGHRLNDLRDFILSTR